MTAVRFSGTRCGRKEFTVETVRFDSYYRYDGSTIALQARGENLDLSRNFPGHWRGEQEQTGAGRYPTYEPEVHALIDFVARHPNVCAGIALHSCSGVLLRAFSHQADEHIPVEDP